MDSWRVSQDSFMVDDEIYVVPTNEFYNINWDGYINNVEQNSDEMDSYDDLPDLVSDSELSNNSYRRIRDAEANDDDDESYSEGESDDETTDTEAYSFTDFLSIADYTNISNFVRSGILYEFDTLEDAVTDIYGSNKPEMNGISSDEAEKIYINIYNTMSHRNAEMDYMENKNTYGPAAISQLRQNVFRKIEQS